MNAVITPGIARGEVMAPPSKSMAHRMLMGAGLSVGTSVVRHIDFSEDIKATLGLLEGLGCEYSADGDTVTIKGIGDGWRSGRILSMTDKPLDAKESGSTLRFFIPLLLSRGGAYRLTGAKSLFARPLGVYETICESQGIFFEKQEDSLILKGTLKPGHFQVPGNISSQFITGLLYALPLLSEDSVIEVLPPVESKAYIDMTLEALRFFGITIRREENIYYISGNQIYRAAEAVVEGDYSNAAFLDALNLIGGDVLVTGLKEESLQGDKIYASYFAKLKEEAPKMDISECPDLGPILMGMAAACHGAAFTGTRRLKIKESDRGEVMARELEKFGIQVEVTENEITVHPGRLAAPKEHLNSHNDHRIAMTLATLCTITGGEIEDCYAIRKSFPGYYDTLRSLGIQVEIL